MRYWLLYCERRSIWWAPRSAGYTEQADEAGRYTDAEALEIADRMNGGGDSPVRLVPLADAERFVEERAGRGGIAPGIPLTPHPRLVEVLREHAEWLGLADRGKESPLYQRSTALLRELGEDV